MTFVGHRMRSVTALLIPVRDFRCLFHPLRISHRLFSLPTERPDPCWHRAPLDCQQAAIASKGRTHQILRLVVWQWPTRHRATPSPWARFNQSGIFDHVVAARVGRGLGPCRSVHVFFPVAIFNASPPDMAMKLLLLLVLSLRSFLLSLSFLSRPLMFRTVSGPQGLILVSI